MNNITLIGNICKDLELKQTNSGKSVCSFNLTVKRPFTKDVTDFLPVVVWNKQAENLCAYCGKGSRIAVSGIMTTRQYEVDGNSRTAYEVMANEVMFLNDRKADAQSNGNVVDSSPLPVPDGFFMGADDDCPF